MSETRKEKGTHFKNKQITPHVNQSVLVNPNSSFEGSELITNTNTSANFMTHGGKIKGNAKMLGLKKHSSVYPVRNLAHRSIEESPERDEYRSSVSRKSRMFAHYESQEFERKSFATSSMYKMKKDAYRSSYYNDNDVNVRYIN